MTLAHVNPPACQRQQAWSLQRRIPCPQRDKPWVLAASILGSSLAFIEGSVVNLALPSIQSDLGVSSSGVQWIMNAYMLVLGAFTLVGGSLGDRYGLRRTFLLGTATFAVGAAGCVAAPGFAWLLSARLVQGFGGALLVPASLALLGSHFDDDERGRAIGTWAGASALTTAIGPVLGGLLVDQWGWRAVFLLVIPLAAATVLIAAWRVPADRPTKGDSPDFVGASLLAAALALLIFALLHAGPASTRAILLGLAALSGAAFIRREQTCANPMLPLALFRERAFSAANLLTLLLYFALSGALYFLPFNLIQVQGWSTTAAGAAFLPFTLIMGLGSTFAGDLIRKFEARKILTAGPLITAAGFFGLALPGRDADYASGFLPGIVAIGIGMTMTVAPLTAVALGSVAKRHAGVASGVNNTAARIAGVLALAMLTALAVAAFTSELQGRLSSSGVPGALANQLLQHSDALAELKPPPGIPPALAAGVRAAVETAYVHTFRILVTACGVLAILSGLIAWVFLPRRHPNAAISPVPH